MMGSIIRAQIMCDVRLALRGGSGWLHALFFFAVFAGFGGLALGPERSNLLVAAPGLIWLALIFSYQMSGAQLFHDDMEDGTLAVIGVEHAGFASYITGRLIAIWLTIALPLIALSPVFFVMYGLNVEQSFLVSLIIILASPAILLASLVAAAVSAGIRTGGLLGIVLSAPLSVPVMIFGIGATEQLLERGDFFSPPLLLLIAISLFYGVVLPPFAILSLRLGLE